MSPSSGRWTFWRRVLRIASVAWLLLVAWIVYNFTGISTEGTAGLAAVSAGISELVFELFLLVTTAIVVVWVWERFAHRRS